MPNHVRDVLPHAMSGNELSRVRTEFYPLRILPTVPPHPVQPNRQSTCHRHLGNTSLPTHRQVHVPTSPVRILTCRCLCCLHQQETQQRAALLADVTQPLMAGTGVLPPGSARHSCRSACHTEPFRSSDDQHEGQCRQRTNARMSHQSQHLGPFLASCSTTAVNSSMVGFIRSSNSSRSCRRPGCPGSKRKLFQLCSSCVAPQLLLPSLTFIHRQRLQLIHDPRAHLHHRCRCHSSCRRSRFSGLGTQICGKLFSSISLRRSRASLRSVFCFFTRLALISAGSPIHSSKPNSASSRSNQREYPVASIPTRTRIPRCFRSR